MKLHLNKCASFIFILICSPISFANLDQYDLVYRLKLADRTAEKENMSCFDVEMVIKGNEKGEFLLRIPHNITQIFIPKENLISMDATKEEGVFNFRFAPKRDTKINYKYCPVNPTRTIYEPIIEPDFFHFLAGNVLINPEHAVDPMNIKVDFKELPSQFTVATAHSIQEKVYTVNQPIQNFRDSAFVGSIYEVETINIKNQPVHIMTKDKWTLFDNKDFVYYLEKLITAQRTFWNDFDFPHYVIVLIKLESPDAEKYIHGFHKKNILSMSIPDGKIEKLYKVFYSLSHELFHAWLGISIEAPQPQGNLQWFFEGLNDFYGLQFALKSGIIDRKSYIQVYNQSLQSYYVSPFYQATNNEISEHFLNSHIYYGIIAQVRGHIVFNDYIARHPRGSEMYNPLDMALKEIGTQFGRKSGKVITENDLDIIFSKHLGDQEWSQMKRSIETGKLGSISPYLLEGEAVLIKKSVWAPSFGFDTEALIKHNALKSLKTNSNAYRAGLRKNDHILVHHFALNTPRVVAQVVVEKSGESKLIKFYPEKVIKYIPQYALVNVES